MWTPIKRPKRGEAPTASVLPSVAGVPTPPDTQGSPVPSAATRVDTAASDDLASLQRRCMLVAQCLSLYGDVAHRPTVTPEASFSFLETGFASFDQMRRFRAMNDADVRALTESTERAAHRYREQVTDDVSQGEDTPIVEWLSRLTELLQHAPSNLQIGPDAACSTATMEQVSAASEGALKESSHGTRVPQQVLRNALLHIQFIRRRAQGVSANVVPTAGTTQAAESGTSIQPQEPVEDVQHNAPLPSPTMYQRALFETQLVRYELWSAGMALSELTLGELAPGRREHARALPEEVHTE